MKIAAENWQTPMLNSERGSMVVVQNLVFWTLFFTVSALFIPLAVMTVTVQALVMPRRYTMRRVRRSIAWYGWSILYCAWPFARVRYRDFAPQEKDGPFIFVCNHRSASDPFLMACLPFEVIQIANIWPFKLPVLGICARIAGYLSIREMPLEEFYARGSRLLAQGVCVASFPEGTRSGSRKMGPFNGTIFRLAQMNKASIVPLAISGNERIPPKGSLVLHPGRVFLDKLPAVTWEMYQDMSAFKLKNHVHGLLNRHLEETEKDLPAA